MKILTLVESTDTATMGRGASIVIEIFVTIREILLQFLFLGKETILLGARAILHVLMEPDDRSHGRSCS